MKTKEEKIARIAALLAVSNLGHFHNIKVDDFTKEDTIMWSGDPYSDVCMIAGHLMENDEHEEYFGEEARMWHERFIVRHTPRMIADEFPWHAEWINKIAEIPEE